MGKIRAKKEIKKFQNFLEKKIPFVFVRFSDGEMEILRNRYLKIENNKVTWSRGTVNISYPAYDFKTFDPAINQDLRKDLIESACFKSSQYFKGIPTKHNNALLDRDYMINLNKGDNLNLTFADLFLNNNYKYFLKNVVKIFLDFSNVAVVCNNLMNPKLYHSRWRKISIPNDFFTNYSKTKDQVLLQVSKLPSDSLILSSASSLSNIIGSEISKNYQKMTFIDIGTSMHHLMGLNSQIRAYHLELESWFLKSSRDKLIYKLSKSSRIKW